MNIETLAATGQRALGALICKFKTLGDMGYKTFTKCFNASICPVIDYGAGIWGNVKNPKMDQVQNKAIRVFLGINRHTAIAFLEGNMGWEPGVIRRKIHMLRLWNLGTNGQPSFNTKNI